MQFALNAVRVMDGMVLLEAARFTMGPDRFYREEAPAHERLVDAFWIDAHPVTNQQFAAFVQDTGHVTVAERPVPLRMATSHRDHSCSRQPRAP